MPDSFTGQTATLRDKVREWLETEGYPLEFRVARAFQRCGFDTLQGQFVQDETGHESREIDITAAIDSYLGKQQFFRVYQVLECKWSKDKPWVVFTSPRTIMGEAACIAQTVGSELGRAAMFCIAGESTLHDLEIFKPPVMGGFSGRRALEQRGNAQDMFYATMQGLVGKTVSKAKEYDGSERTFGRLPSAGCLAFPVIIIEGNLFEAHYDPKQDNVALEETQQIRVFWRGARAGTRWITPVDIITVSAVDEFAKRRASDIKTLLVSATRSVLNIQEAFKRRRFANLKITKAARGFTGFPPLLAELYVLERKQRKKR